VEDAEDEKPVLNTDYTGFSIYGHSLCLVVDPPTTQAEVALPVKKKRAKKAKGGVEEWFVNINNDVPSVDDS
jgi:hypothetical protein